MTVRSSVPRPRERSCTWPPVTGGDYAIFRPDVTIGHPRASPEVRIRNFLTAKSKRMQLPHLACYWLRRCRDYGTSSYMKIVRFVRFDSYHIRTHHRPLCSNIASTARIGLHSCPTDRWCKAASSLPKASVKASTGTRRPSSEVVTIRSAPYCSGQKWSSTETPQLTFWVGRTVVSTAWTASKCLVTRLRGGRRNINPRHCINWVCLCRCVCERVIVLNQMSFDYLNFETLYLDF